MKFFHIDERQVMHQFVHPSVSHPVYYMAEQRLLDQLVLDIIVIITTPSEIKLHNMLQIIEKSLIKCC